MKSLPLDFTAATLQPSRVCVIERMDGQVIRIADAQGDITIGSHTYTAIPGVTFNAIKHVIGGEMPSTDINVAHSATASVSPLVSPVFSTADIDSGLYDGATVDIYVVNRANLGAGLGLLFTGTVQPSSYGYAGHATLQIRGHASKAAGLFMQTFGPMCRTDLYSILCGVDPDIWLENGAVATIVDQFNFNLTIGGSVRPDGYFNNGVMVTETGFAFEIANWVQATALVTTYLPICSRHLAVGMAITAWPGCDKTMGVGGCPRYDNEARFQGEDHFLGASAFAAG